MTVRAAYDEDFYLWSQEQARLLRDLPRATALPNSLDLAHIAEEIEDMGKSELNTVLSCLQQLFVHLIKLKANGLDASPARGWVSEILAFHRRAQRGYSPGMRQLVDIDRLWREAVADAAAELAIYRETAPILPLMSPFGLDELLTQNIDLGAMLDALSSVDQDQAG